MTEAIADAGLDDAQPKKSSATKSSATKFLAFQIFWALSGIALFVVTWRLWLPVTAFPAIPLLDVFCAVPLHFDWAFSGLAVGSLLLVLLSTRSRLVTIGLILFVTSMLGLILMDQHRLQPWAYQFVVFAVVMAACPRNEAWKLMRWITVSIYFYSAVSKFDYQFTETLGRAFLNTLVGFSGHKIESWSPENVSRSILLFPTIELLLAVGLLFRSTRRLAGFAVAVMHAVLLAILGPFGLNHEWGVLVWNLYLLGQAVFLFCGRELIADPPNRRSIGRWLANGLVGFVMVFPLSVELDVCDHWPAWEVYAPRTSRAKLEFSAADLDQFPTGLQELCFEAEDQPGVIQFPLDRWSLAARHVPIYPEDRFQFGVARELVRRFDLQNYRISIGGQSNRWNGMRKSKTVAGTDAIEAEAARFWLNTLARKRN